jgi:hypothetical protein
VIETGEKYLGDFVKAQSFVDVSVEALKMPNGGWPEGFSIFVRDLRYTDPRAKVVGWYSKGVFGKGVDASEPILRAMLPELTEVERQEFMNKVKADIENDEYHSYTPWYSDMLV